MVPVRVYFREPSKMPPSDEVDCDGLDGLCVLNSEDLTARSISIFIRIGTLREMLDTLQHEWAHAISWTNDYDDHHGPGWGVAISAVRRVMEEIDD